MQTAQLPIRRLIRFLCIQSSVDYKLLRREDVVYSCSEADASGST